MQITSDSFPAKYKLTGEGTRMQDVFDYIEAHIDESIAILMELVRQPSVSAQRLGFDEAPELVKRLLEDAGLAVEIWPAADDGLPSVFGEASGASPHTVLFYTHYDVQPPEPLDLWESPPFDPQRRGDRLFGRGMSDDKGNIVARLAAIKAFQQVRSALPCGVKFFAEGEEEIGSLHLPDLVKERAERLKADACIWEGGGRNASNDPFMYLGLKGILTAQLKVKSLTGDAHSSYATVLPSAPWRLLAALQTLRAEDGRVLIDGFYDDVRETTPAEDVAIKNLPDETEEWARTFGAGQFLGGLSGEALRRRHLLAPTCNIDGIWSGYQGPGTKTVLPAEATATLDFRLVPEMRPRDIFEKLRRHLEANGFDDIDLEYLGGENPSRTSMDSPWVRLVAQAAREVYGREPVISPTMAGTGPMYEFADVLGMPIATSGVDHPSHRIHAPNENITLEDFLLGAKHAALIMERLGERGLTGQRTSTDPSAGRGQGMPSASRPGSFTPTLYRSRFEDSATAEREREY